VLGQTVADLVFPGWMVIAYDENDRIVGKFTLPEVRHWWTGGAQKLEMFREQCQSKLGGSQEPQQGSLRSGIHFALERSGQLESARFRSADVKDPISFQKVLMKSLFSQLRNGPASRRFKGKPIAASRILPLLVSG
jgi:hypothetical protein